MIKIKNVFCDRTIIMANYVEIEKVYLTDVLSQDTNHQVAEIQSVNFENINYEHFFREYLLKNIPCIVKNVSKSWNCTKEWVNAHSINYNYLKGQYGNLEAPVANCSNMMFNSHCKQDMYVSAFVDYLQSDSKEELLYLKDWHLRRSRPDDHFYKIPYIFASDWLNEYSVDKQEDDFMFVYIGPENSWTPLHADVYSSYSWSVNVVGQKKWILFPPGEEEKLKDSLGNLPELFEPDISKGIKYYNVTQEEGDAIFVPSCWCHQVINELDTISINHNWINGCNIQKVWEALAKSLISVENEIKEFSHTDEFPEQCQLILKSLFGMDFASFINFLCYIGQKRLSQLQGSDKLGIDGFCLGRNHIIFDLKQVLKVINICIYHPAFSNCRDFMSNINYDIFSLRNSITSALN